MLNDDKEAESYDLREDQCHSTKDTTTKVSKTKETFKSHCRNVYRNLLVKNKRENKNQEGFKAK